MSLGYAEKLSYIEDVGKVGMTEFFEPPHLLQEKIERLTRMIQKSKHLVVFTGAGISTSCGIPDFRGPKGIWTLQRQGKTMPQASLPFHRATPSITHMALVELERVGFLKFVVSQNIDGLHLRSGISREHLAELHGNSFMELCPSCGAEYMRDFEVETIGLKETTRHCSKRGCGSKLRDTVLDWEDALPPKEMDPAEKHCEMADVVLCLGTSLQIRPACNLPLKCLRNGGKVVIVNLQKTPHDKKASLVIHGLVDKVIAGVMKLLALQIPPFVRIDLFQTILSQALSIDKKYVNWTLAVQSVNGKKAPLPFIESIEVLFPEGQNMKATVLEKQPLLLKRRNVRMTKQFDVLLKLKFSAGCKCSHAELRVPVDFEALQDCFKGNKDSIFQELKETAIKNPCCGQIAFVERNTVVYPKSEVAVHAIVTDIVQYETSFGAPEGRSNDGQKRKFDGKNEKKISRKRSKMHKNHRRD